MKTADQILEILTEITYKQGWRILFKTPENSNPYIQVIFDGEDEKTGIIDLQKCRKWQMSYHMTTTEIVYTALKAIQAAEDHETREFFKYKGVRIANPHFSVDDIVQMVNDNKLREESRLLEPNK